MFSMFVAWMVTFALVFVKPKYAPVAAILTMVLTLVLLRSHISDPIPLNF